MRPAMRRAVIGRLAAAALAVAALAAAPSRLSAQTDGYPNRTVRMVVGPASDAALRVVAEGLRTRLGQPFVVENRPGGGGGGEIAVRAVATAPPDGYTFLFATSAQAIAMALGVANFDLMKEFEPVTLINLSSFVLAVHPSVPANSVQELIALAKSKPKTVNCAYGGTGTPQHLACEMFAKLAGVEVVMVPYRDAGSMAKALLAGEVQMLFSVASAIATHVQAGSVRGLAVTTAERSRFFPQLPTMIEAGLPDFQMSGWGSLLAPATTPQAAAERINTTTAAVFQEPEVRKRFDAIRLDIPPPANPAGVREFIRNDLARWNRIIDLTGVKRGAL